MSHRNFYSQNYSSVTNSYFNDQQPPFCSNSTFWPSSSNMNSFHLNPTASPFKTSYQRSEGFFNLSSINKNKTEVHNNISKPLQKLNSEIRSSSHSLTQNDHQRQSSLNLNKKHKRESRLDELQEIINHTKEEIRHYERKRKRLFEDLDSIKDEIKSCDTNLFNYQKKLRNVQLDYEREKKRQNDNKQNPFTNNLSTSPSNNRLSNNTSSSSSNYSPVNASATSINNLNINSNTTSNINSKVAKNSAPLAFNCISKPIMISNQNLNQNLNPNLNPTLNPNSNTKINAQSTINNIITNLLEKKKDVEFLKFDYIFTIEEEVFEAKPIDASTKYEINITFKKLLSSEEKKTGYRYIIRGCIYDSKSIHQSDNLSFVKSYEFVTNNKRHTYENHDISSNKLIFPFDITDYCRFDKKLTININLNKKSIENKKIAFGVYFVKRLDYNQTLELVRKDKIIRRKSSDITKKQVTNAFDQSAGIQMDSYKIALIDPLSKSKISMPCIGETCEHISIFDGLTFLESNSKKFPWFCPICGRPIGYNQLFYDELIQEILKKVSMDCTAIAFDKSSNWMPLSDINNKKDLVEEEEDIITLE